MTNYILKTAVVAGQIDCVNGFTVYFKDGGTMEVDNAFITQQSPGPGDYVLDGTKVMSRAKFEELYLEELVAEVTDEGEVIAGLQEELKLANDALAASVELTKETGQRFADYKTANPETSVAEGNDTLDPGAPVVEEAGDGSSGGGSAVA